LLIFIFDHHTYYHNHHIDIYIIINNYDYQIQYQYFLSIPCSILQCLFTFNSRFTRWWSYWYW